MLNNAIPAQQDANQPSAVPSTPHGSYTVEPDDSRTFDLLDQKSSGLRQSEEFHIHCVRVPIGYKILIDCDHVISDFDDTIAHGSGEHAHDGPSARFARALSRCLWNLHADDQFLQEFFVERYQNSDNTTLFDAETWAEYAQLGGKAEATVMQNIAAHASIVFGVNISEETYAQAVHDVVQEHLHALLARVTLDEGAVQFAERVVEAGGSAAICSASGNAFVVPAAIHLLGKERLEAAFGHVVGGAKKKLDCGNYTGEGVAQTCERIDAIPQATVMLGDTMSDVAAIIAGVGTVVIRIPEYGVNGRLSDEALQQAASDKVLQIESMVKNLALNRGSELGRSLPGITPTVIFVQDFAQLEYRGRSQGCQARYSPVQRADTQSNNPPER
jgi:phosphoglycolate phosphatase-like HAD superfamily hydrolase